MKPESGSGPLAPPCTFLPPLPDPRGDGPEHGTVAGRIERERHVLREGEALRARRLFERARERA